MLKVLIVEDEWLIGEDLRMTIEGLGHEVFGPALDCAAALELIWLAQPDVALVDTQLGEETCEAVLVECRSRAVPVIVTSGHSPDNLPEFAKGFPHVGKPYLPQDIEAALANTDGA